MGYFKQIYKQRYNFIYQQQIDTIGEETEEYLELYRKVSYEQMLPQVSERIKNLSKNELEVTRVDYIHQLDNVKLEIDDEWKKLAHKTTIAAMTYNYISYFLLIPPFVLLIMNQVLLSQICLLVTAILIFLINYDPIRDNLSFYIYGVNKVSDSLSDLYTLYGVMEATITATDYRNIYKVDQSRCIFSGHHQKAPD